MFSGRQFTMCQTEVPFWHVANVGTRSEFLSIYFTGNLFQYQGLYQSVLTLFPMTAITIPMETEVTGERKAHLHSVLHMNVLPHECPSQVRKSCCPATFRFIPAPTHQNQIVEFPHQQLLSSAYLLQMCCRKDASKRWRTAALEDWT